MLLQLGATTFSITRLIFPCSFPQVGKKNSKGQRGGARDGAGKKRRRDHYAMRSVYEIVEDEVRYRYGLMGASVGHCLMSDIVRVVGPNEEGISI